MATAETANLLVKLSLQNNLTGPLQAATGRVSAMSNVLGGTASNFALVKQAAGATGTAIAGMASHLKGVITGPLGLLGLGAGLFTVGGLLKAGTEEASSFGLEVAKLAALTGLSVETTSALSSALDHFGISGDAAVRTVGMITKNIGMIVNTKAGLAGFAKTFGLTLTDAKGRLVDVNQEILRTADYFNNKSIPATTKAAALQKLYGRQWQSLIPFLSAGRKGIIEAEQAAKDLGLTLTAQNVNDLKKYRENFLTLGDAAKGLQLQLGLVLIPALSDLAKSFTGFLREGGTGKIVAFFKDLVQKAKDLGVVITGTIIPTLSGLAGAAKGFWDTIPAPLRDLLFKGIVADRTIHFLFGVSPINLAKNLLGDIVGPIFNQFAARGATPANPLFVADVTGGLGGAAGLAEGAAAAAGGVGLLTVALSAGTLAAVGVAFVSAMQQVPDLVPASAGGTPGQVFSPGHGFGPRSGHGQEGAGSGGLSSERGSAQLILAAQTALHAAQAQLGASRRMERSEQTIADRAANAAAVKAAALAVQHQLGSAIRSESADRALMGKGPFNPWAKLDPSQITDIRGKGGVAVSATAQAQLGVARRSERLEQTIANRLTTLQGRLVPAIAKTTAAEAAVQRAIHNKKFEGSPVTAITTVNVNVTASGIKRIMTFQRRYGPASGSKYNTGSGLGPGGA